MNIKHNDVNAPVLKRMLWNLSFHIREYRNLFFRTTKDSGELCELYISGLLKTEHGRRNMERLHEELDMKGDGYQRIQQFITDSTWDGFGLMREIAQNTSKLYSMQPCYDVKDVGYIFDESAHLKKGKESVGVSRQYAGVIGKVDNCQVGVYASLVWQNHTSIINCRLFLPECWSADSAKCAKAGIPEDKCEHKTKLELALDMLKADIAAGVRFGWVGGDGFYGHGCELNYAVEDMGLTFLFDVHNDQEIYEQEPEIFIPEKESVKGRIPTLPRTLAKSIKVKNYKAKLDESQWETVEVRDTTKGKLKLSIHLMEVWVWDKKEERARKRVLVISRNIADNKIKYGLSNADIIKTPVKQFAFMQAQRYWIERSLQECKSELGMSDYQIRKWNGWHHHMALVMLALSFIVKERIKNQDNCPLLSCRDIRILIIALLAEDELLIQKRMLQMQNRHRQREKDTQRYLKT